MNGEIRIIIPKVWLDKHLARARAEYDEASEASDKGTGYQFDLLIDNDELYIEDDGQLHQSFTGGEDEPSLYISLPLEAGNYINFAHAIKLQHQELTKAAKVLQEARV